MAMLAGSSRSGSQVVIRRELAPSRTATWVAGIRVELTAALTAGAAARADNDHPGTAHADLHAVLAVSWVGVHAVIHKSRFRTRRHCGPFLASPPREPAAGQPLELNLISPGQCRYGRSCR